MLKTEMVGMKFIPGAIEMLSHMKDGDELQLIREPVTALTAHDDGNAVALYYAGRHIGYVPRAFNWNIAPMMDRGTLLKCKILLLTWSNDGYSYCEILIERQNDD